MPRKARLLVPGCFYHVMARGIRGSNIFQDDEDRAKYLSFLTEYLARSGCTCHAWTLMSNHYHLLIQTGEQSLAELMRPLNSRYAQYHARKHQLRGYLFQDRYKSVATQDQRYVREIVRYIHGNPLRAGICKNLGELANYPWSSHAAFLGRKDCEFVDSWVVLRGFGRTKTEAREAYQEFMADGLGQPDEELIKLIRMTNQGKADTHNPGCWVIGDPELVKAALALDKTNRVRLARYRAEGVTLSELGREFARKSGIREQDLLRRSRGTRFSSLRHAFAFTCRKEYGFPVNEIGSYLGINGSAATQSIRQGEELIRKKPEFNQVPKVRP